MGAGGTHHKARYLSRLFQAPLNSVELTCGDHDLTWDEATQWPLNQGLPKGARLWVSLNYQRVWGGREEIGRAGYFYEKEKIDIALEWKLY